MDYNKKSIWRARDRTMSERFWETAGHGMRCLKFDGISVMCFTSGGWWSMKKVCPATCQSSDGRKWHNFGELVNIASMQSHDSAAELWEKFRESQRSSGGLIYTTAGLIDFNAEKESPRDIHADFRSVFVLSSVAGQLISIKG